MSEIRTLKDGDIDVLPRTVASAVQTADGSTVEQKINSIEAPDLSIYATTAYVDGQVDVLESSISGLSQTTTTQGENISALETEVDDLKNSVSDGKTLVANAITAKGVTTATTASFQIMANNIAAISTGIEGKTIGTKKLISSKYVFDKYITSDSSDYYDVELPAGVIYISLNWSAYNGSTSRSGTDDFNPNSSYYTITSNNKASLDSDITCVSSGDSSGSGIRSRIVSLRCSILSNGKLRITASGINETGLLRRFYFKINKLSAICYQ